MESNFATGIERGGGGGGEVVFGKECSGGAFQCAGKHTSHQGHIFTPPVPTSFAP